MTRNGRVDPGGDGVRNPFDSDSVAHRYATGRPYYHDTALDLAADRLGIDRVHLALDIGCGTGLSSRAVRGRADRVIALDLSLPMLHAAEALTDVHYVAAGAEQIPLPDASADLATVGAALHWFDQPRAFAEIARVLRTGAALIVYSDFFNGRLAHGPAFTDWFTDSYLPDYPTPARHAYFDPDAADAAGFSRPDYDQGKFVVPLTCSQVADYLLSQSNAAVALESGRIDAATLRDQIISRTTTFFPDGRPADVVFGVRVWTCSLHRRTP